VGFIFREKKEGGCKNDDRLVHCKVRVVQTREDSHDVFEITGKGNGKKGKNSVHHINPPYLPS
jgi:hypothetical protein